jgi:hypothetical protein
LIMTGAEKTHDMNSPCLSKYGCRTPSPSTNHAQPTHRVFFSKINNNNNNNNNNNKHAYAGQLNSVTRLNLLVLHGRGIICNKDHAYARRLNSFTHLRALLVLHNRGFLDPFDIIQRQAYSSSFLHDRDIICHYLTLFVIICHLLYIRASESLKVRHQSARTRARIIDHVSEESTDYFTSTLIYIGLHIGCLVTVAEDSGDTVSSFLYMLYS